MSRSSSHSKPTAPPSPNDPHRRQTNRLRSNPLTIIQNLPFFFLLLLHLHQPNPTNAKPPRPPFHHTHISRFLHSRTSPSSPSTPSSTSLWTYQGHLVDPTTSTIVANVQGLELLSLLSETRPVLDGSNPRDVFRSRRGLRRLGDLAVRKALEEAAEEEGGDGGGGGWDYAGTVLSRKLFCYTVPRGEEEEEEEEEETGMTGGDRNGYKKDGGGEKRLMEWRARPTSPKRRLGKGKSVVAYDTAVTYVSREGGSEMAVFTEWPDGRWVRGVATSTNAAAAASNNQKNASNQREGDEEGGGGPVEQHSTDTQQRRSFEFTSFATAGPTTTKFEPNKHRHHHHPKPTLSDLTQLSLLQKRRRRPNGTLRPPPRSKLIQFGRDVDSELRKYGARETYSFTTVPPSSSPLEPKPGHRRRLVGLVRAVERLGQRVVFEVGERLRYYPLGEEACPSLLPSNDGDEGKSGGGCLLRYTRYGEGPPWYGPGRMCTLELWGRKVDRLEDLGMGGLGGEVVKGLLEDADCADGFLAGFGMEGGGSGGEDGGGSGGMGGTMGEREDGRRRRRRKGRRPKRDRDNNNDGEDDSRKNPTVVRNKAALTWRARDLIAIRAVDSFHRKGGAGPTWTMDDLGDLDDVEPTTSNGGDDENVGWFTERRRRNVERVVGRWVEGGIGVARRIREASTVVSSSSDCEV